MCANNIAQMPQNAKSFTVTDSENFATLTAVTHVCGVQNVPESRDDANENENRKNVKRETRFRSFNLDKCNYTMVLHI